MKHRNILESRKSLSLSEYAALEIEVRGRSYKSLESVRVPFSPR